MRKNMLDALSPSIAQASDARAYAQAMPRARNERNERTKRKNYSPLDSNLTLGNARRGAARIDPLWAENSRMNTAARGTIGAIQ